MPFPFAEAPALIGSVLLPALHFLFGLSATLAAGGALLMLVPGYQASWSVDPRWSALARRSARAVLILLLGAAAPAGAGAWVGEMVLRPQAVERLAAAFGGALAAGWLLLLLGSVFLAVYARGWRRGRGGSPAHLAAGLLAAGGLWLGAAVFVSLQSFPVNPGRWLESRTLRDALLHPSLIPAFALWGATAVLLASTAGLAYASAQRDAPWRMSLVQALAKWAAPAAGVGAAAGLGWALSLPAGTVGRGLAGLVGGAVLLQAGLGVYLALHGVRLPGKLGARGALAAAAAAVLAPVLLWQAREEARGPFLVRGYLYRNGILAEQIETFRREGFWRPAPWGREKGAPAPEALGALVFRAECAPCHPSWRAGAREAALPPFRYEGSVLQFLNEMEKRHPDFPAFAGSEGEKRAVAAHIEGLLQAAGVTLAARPPQPPAASPAPPKAEEKKAPPPAPKPPEPARETPPAAQTPPKEAPAAPPKEPEKTPAPAGQKEAPKPPAPEKKPDEAKPEEKKPEERQESPAGRPAPPAPQAQSPPAPPPAPPSSPGPRQEAAPPAPQAAPQAPPAPPAGSAPPAAGGGNPGGPGP